MNLIMTGTPAHEELIAPAGETEFLKCRIVEMRQRLIGIILPVYFLSLFVASLPIFDISMNIGCGLCALLFETADHIAR